MLAVSPDFKVTFNDFCSLCHLPSPPQDFLVIVRKEEGEEHVKALLHQI